MYPTVRSGFLLSQNGWREPKDHKPSASGAWPSAEREIRLMKLGGNILFSTTKDFCISYTRLLTGPVNKTLHVT